MVGARLEIATPEKYYRSPQRCIYCSRKAVTLTKEHIIPFGLAANSLVMSKGSCRKCADETKKYETAVLRHMWWPFRTHLGMPTRHRNQVPGDFTMMRTHPGAVLDGVIPPKADLIEQVPAEEYPLFFYSFHYDPPGVISDRPAHQDNERAFWLGDLASLRKQIDDKQAFRVGELNSEALSLMLAKIGHAYAVAELGFNSFHPTLTLAIRNKAIGRLLYWVGCTEDEPSKPTEALHEIGLRLRKIRGKQYIAAQIRLFGCVGTPTYEIIVGEPYASFDKFSLLEQPLYRIDINGPLPIGKLVPILDVTGLPDSEVAKLTEENPG